jgi:hypothetical protein
MNSNVQKYAKDKNIKAAAAKPDDTKAQLKSMLQKAQQFKSSVKSAGTAIDNVGLDGLMKLVVMSKSEYVSAYAPVLKELGKDIDAVKKLLRKIEQVASGVVQDFEKLVK